MSEEREHLDYVRDIRDNFACALRFVEGMSYEQFLCDEKTKYAVVRALEIVGEATKHVPARVRKNYPDGPWKQMAGMRDRLIHGYRGTDWEIVWKAATSEAARYIPLIEAVLREEEARGIRES